VDVFFFDERMGGLWAMSRPTNSSTENEVVRCWVAGHQIAFPFPPYAPQLAIMSKVLHAIHHSEHALIEAPTGTGKTLALLCATLQWVQDFHHSAHSSSSAQTNSHQSEEKKNVQSHKRTLRSEEDDPLTTTHTKKLKTETFVHKNSPPLLTNSHHFNYNNNNNNNNNNNTNTRHGDDDDDFVFLSSTIRTQCSSSMFNSTCETNPKGQNVNNENVSQKIRAKVYYATRTHAQIRKVVADLRKTTYRPRMAVLGSREHTCTHPHIRKSPTRDFDWYFSCPDSLLLFVCLLMFACSND
jgi:Fanconi anemia group J protein